MISISKTIRLTLSGILLSLITGFVSNAQTTKEIEVSQGEAVISTSPFYPTIDSYSNYYDTGNQIVLCKAGPTGIAIQVFDKDNQTVKAESIASNKPCTKILTFLDMKDLLVHFIYSKDAPNKLIKAQKEIYLASYDLESGKFSTGETLLYTTSYNFTTLFTYSKYPETFETGGFICSVSPDKKQVRLAYQALYYNKDKNTNYSTVCNHISISEKKMISEKVLENNFGENLLISDFNPSSSSAISFITKGEKSKEYILLIGSNSEESSENIYVNLSDELHSIDTIRFFDNESNSNLLVGGFYYQDGDLSRPGVFSMEIDLNGSIVKKCKYLLDQRENTTQKIYNNYCISAIYPNENKSTDFYVLNLQTSYLLHLLIDEKNQTIKNERILIKDITKSATRIIPHPAYGLTVNSTGIAFSTIARITQHKVQSRLKIIRDQSSIFAFQIHQNPETKKEDLYVTKLNTENDDCVSYLLFSDYKLSDGQVMKQFHFSRVIMTGKNTFNFEAYFGKKMDAMVKIVLN